VDEWADQNRILPKGSAEPGPFRTSRTPYLKAIMAACIDPKIKTVCFVAASQLGKTELQLNVMGYRLDVDPMPIMFVSPTQRLAESVSQTRVMPMIRSTPALLDKLDQTRSNLKITEKFIAGVRLGFAWLSATELSSHPTHTLMIDELDRMSDIPGEGDVVTLASARTTTFVDSKIIVCSSPTIEGASAIMDLYLGGTQQRWTWPCPSCNQYFAPSFDLLKWEPKSNPTMAKRTAYVECPHCGVRILDKDRGSMNTAGRYEAQLGGDPASDCASFMVSGLASPWRSWGEAAKQWVAAAHSRDQERIRAVLNTTFGELYRIQGDAPPAELVKELRAGYRSNELPAGVIGITVGVDVQKSCLYYVIRAWGEGSTSWLIRHGQLYGETDQPSVWADLAHLFEESWGVGDRQLRVNGMLIDSGYRPDPVYNFVARFPGRARASKGHQALATPVKASDAEPKRGIKLMHINTYHFKDFVHTRIRTPLGERGAFNLPIDASNDYCEMLVSESKVVKPNGTVVWVHDRNVENHYFDAEVLAAAAAYLSNYLDRRVAPPPKADPAETDPPAPAPRTPQRPSQRGAFGAGFSRPGGGNWATNWRR